MDIALEHFLDQDADIVDKRLAEDLVELGNIVPRSEISPLLPLHMSDYGADFYWKIEVNQPGQSTQFAESAKPYSVNQDHINPDATYIFPISDNYAYSYVDVSIFLYDVDWTITWDAVLETCDIANSGTTAIMRYDLLHGSWSGSDYHGDSTGYGHVSGNEDGSLSVDENDCELWFNIKTNDVWEDYDEFACWEEVNYYRSDPTLDNSDGDWDGDGIPNGYEKKNGLNPLSCVDALSDLDQDLVPNLWEYELRSRGKSPDNPYDAYSLSLTVSLNWDASQDYLDSLEEGLRCASSFLFEVTDGYFLASFNVYNDNVHWDDADICIHEGTSPNPHTVISPLQRRVTNMPSSYQPTSDQSYGPNEYWYFRALTHEICHYSLLLWDEYCEWWDIFETSPIPNEFLLNTIMAGKWWGSIELSTGYDYDQLIEYCINTNQLDALRYVFTLQYCLGGGPCWQRIFSDWNYFSGTLPATNQVPRGIEFDLNNDGSIDIEYYSYYHADSFDSANDWYLYSLGLGSIRYPVGDYVNISIS